MKNLLTTAARFRDAVCGPWIIAGIVAVILLAALIGMAHAAEFTGRANWNAPYEGDTFWLCDTGACSKIRLCGIDAPERGTPDADKSSAALRAIIGFEPLTCTQVGGGTPCDGLSEPTNGDRVVAQCITSYGSDVAAELVNSGYACDWVKFSGGYYSAGESNACRK